MEITFRHLSCFILFCGMFGTLRAQEPGAMTVKQVQDFKRISHKFISPDGKWVVAVTEPWRGDGDRNGTVPSYSGDAEASLYDSKGRVVKTFLPVSGVHFTASSRYVVATVKAFPEKEREARLLKAQNSKKNGKGSKEAKAKEDKPMDLLHIYTIGKTEDVIDSLRNYKLAVKSDWVAYQRGKKDSTLVVRTLDGRRTFTCYGVAQYQFDKQGTVLCFVGKEKSDGTPGLYLLPLQSGCPVLLKEGQEHFSRLTFSEDGRQLAFLYAPKKEKSDKGMSLWNSADGKSARMILDRHPEGSPEGWVISENGTLSYSRDGSRLFFGTAPLTPEKDTLTLERNRPDVQVWSWDEPVQATVQNVRQKTEEKRTYAAMYEVASGKFFQLADRAHPEIRWNPGRTGKWALLSASEAYSRSSMWEGKTRNDYYAVSLEDGTRRLLSQGDYCRLQLSPTGRYAYGYVAEDSLWRALDLENGKEHVLTRPSAFRAWDEDHDTPSCPPAYGMAGWTADDESILLYDRYDLWQCRLSDGTLVNLTRNGRERRLQYRLIRMEKPEELQAGAPVCLSDPQWLLAFDERTKGYAYYRARLLKEAPALLMGGDCLLGRPVKAEEADKVIFTRESYEYFPDVWLSDLTFTKPLQLTYGVEQQRPYIWGTAELISWTSYNGVKLEGVLYKPANFDPTKKYPLIVNFYERNSETLHSYRMPQPGRSTPDYHMYNSQGYILFNPDVRYVAGHPGECCYDCVMSGIDKVLEGGYIDEKRIGGTGHSWGGYQMAYLATRTGRFAAIESGAPVVNMFSAYGGIRWATGLARSFQYEHTQSRIGASIWEHPELYAENSPLLNLDKVTTPILIMHNDADGHVPWYQGIEFFVGMKRLDKPCWMLNYTGEPHWPVKMANRVDFQTRLLQFFNHYLKGEPMPQWMSDGVRAVERPYKLGY